MSNIDVPIPEEVLLALKLDRASLEAEVRLMAAIKLLELGRLSAGAAATLAGLPKPAFLSRLGMLGVTTFDLSWDIV